MRTHFNRTITDAQGKALAGAIVRVLEPGTENPIPESLYTDKTGSTTRSNPFVTATGEIDFYLERPRTVRLGVTVGGFERFHDEIEVGVSTDELMLTSPNGTKYQVTVDDNGALTTTVVT